ncbi:MAG: hypothetical protein KY445_07470, partial [Armatimonadetes bacterium]|nr:hypothetical protein [Armatimonadota bacterium]
EKRNPMSPLKAIALCLTQAFGLFHIFVLMRYYSVPGSNRLFGLPVVCSAVFVFWVFFRLLTSKDKE